MLRPLLAAAAATLLAIPAHAQIEYGGTPPSKTYSGSLKSVPTESMPPVDVDALFREDAAKSKDKVPYRFGLPIDVDLGVDNAGVWDDLDGHGRLWRLRIHSDQALSLNFVFSEFRLPDGAELYAYTDSHLNIHGAYNALNNKDNEQFAIQPIVGDAVTLEYFEPSWVSESVKLRVGQVIHAYRDVLGLTYLMNEDRRWDDLIQFGNCEIDVNCPQGNGWEDQINAVALIINGGFLCTGALINNTANDGTQYFVTANHCGGMNNAVFRFNYQRSGCGTGAAPTNQTVQGSVQMAANASVDYRYIRITPQIPASYGVYYMGWNRSGTVPPNTVTVHHPNGGVKKISFDNHPPVKSGTDWRINQWDLGVTEPGSSGCPLFDNNKRFIGQLCCGQATCSFPFNDFYGRMDLAWTNVKSFLDPVGSNPAFIDGFDPNNTQNCGSSVSYGTGCPGTAGLTPALEMVGCFTAGGQVTMNITLGLGGSTALVFFGLNQASIPMSGGCTLNVSPLLPVIVGPIPLGGIFAGQGAASITSTLPASTTAGTITMQAFITDGGSPTGFSNTNGRSVTFQ